MLSPDQIEQYINHIGDDLPGNLSDTIQAAADMAIAVAKGKMNFLKNTAGVGVHDSLEAIMDESTMTLGISMPEHGYFQNFGVNGKVRTDSTELDKDTADAFGKSEGYVFEFGTTNGHPGINPASFLVMEEFLQEVADYVNQNLELQ